MVSLNVTNSLFAAWRDLHDHRPANERDTAFGMGLGDRPKMDRQDDGRVPTFRPLRTTPAHLDGFLRNLFCQTRTGTPTIGTIWAKPVAGEDDPSHPDLPAGLKVGQDRGRVCVVLGGARMAGVRVDDGIFLSLSAEVEVELTRAAGAAQVDLVPYALPGYPPLDRIATVAHELAHSPPFGRLRDEYGEFPDPLVIRSSELPTLVPAGNVQAANDLATADDDPTIDPGKIDRIKWLWPRIEAAGVVARQPLRLDAQTVRVRLRPGPCGRLPAG